MRHVGDLGNIEADKNGLARLEVTDNVFSLEGPKSIIGRSVIVHAQADDFKTQPTGAVRRASSLRRHWNCEITPVRIVYARQSDKTGAESSRQDFLET